jgi:hypothetical protein
MRRVLLLPCLIVASLIVSAGSLWAADASVTAAAPNAESMPLPPRTAGQTPGGQTLGGQTLGGQTLGGQTLGQPNASAPPQQDCPARPPLAEGAPSSIIVELDPNTLWRPRGSEVRFTIRNPGGAVSVTKVRVCFGWSSPDGEFRRNQALIGSPAVRSVSTDNGSVEYGAVVPLLRRIPDGDWWPRRLFAATPYIFTGMFIVPVADMVVEVTTGAGQAVVVTATQVGVTSVIVAWLVVVAVALLVWLIMDRIARYRRVQGRNLLLRVISTRDGYASLSQLQIVLWTMVVAMSAIYVMTLSGNLISISDGTLVLLGIAGATALVARIPGSTQPAANQPAADPPAADPPAADLPLPVPAVATPEWSDLVVPNRATQEIDVTRLQMLAFTLITAGFVLIKVVVDYEIPSIPSNFLILMGVSNSVYVGGRKLPSQPKSGGATP